MRRGEIWVANLNPSRGSEIGKIRPVLVLQADWLTEQGARTIVVLPLSTKVRPEASTLRFKITARDRLRQDSHVVPEKIRALDRSRFGTGPLTHLTEDELTPIEQHLRAVLGMM